MPMGLTILGKAYEDVEILKAGYAFEQLRERRTAPPLSPPLISDALEDGLKQHSPRPILQVTSCTAHASNGLESRILLEGNLTIIQNVQRDVDPQLNIFIDGRKVPNIDMQLCAVPCASEDSSFEFSGSFSVTSPPKPNQRNRVVGKIARESILVLVLARSRSKGTPSGCMRLIHMNDVV